MATNPERPQAEEPAAELPPTPDGDGPHDVPDEEVIDKTLPARQPREGSESPR